MSLGNLYLIPTTLGDNEPLEVLPILVKKIVEQVDYYIVENEKSARRFIKKITPRKSQPSLKIFVLDKYTSELESKTYLDPCLQGKNVGLLSEAGVPAIADPGANIVIQAHQNNIRVIPLVGPSSITLAMRENITWNIICVSLRLIFIFSIILNGFLLLSIRASLYSFSI